MNYSNQGGNAVIKHEDILIQYTSNQLPADPAPPTSMAKRASSQTPVRRGTQPRNLRQRNKAIDSAGRSLGGRGKWGRTEQKQKTEQDGLPSPKRPVPYK